LKFSHGLKKISEEVFNEEMIHTKGKQRMNTSKLKGVAEKSALEKALLCLGRGKLIN
jgi:hypothetical protein